MNDNGPGAEEHPRCATCGKNDSLHAFYHYPFKRVAVLNGGRNDADFPSDRFSSRMKAKGKGHVSFPNRRLFQPALALQALSSRPHLTLAMPAVIALLAALLVHHRIAATLRTQIARNAQVAEAQWS